MKCDSCGKPAQRSCTRCGRFFCDEHGGDRLVGEGAGPGYRVVSRGLCDGCSPNQALMGIQQGLGMALVVLVLIAIFVFFVGSLGLRPKTPNGDAMKGTAVDDDERPFEDEERIEPPQAKPMPVYQIPPMPDDRLGLFRVVPSEMAAAVFYYSLAVVLGMLYGLLLAWGFEPLTRMLRRFSVGMCLGICATLPFAATGPVFLIILSFGIGGVAIEYVLVLCCSIVFGVTLFFALMLFLGRWWPRPMSVTSVCVATLAWCYAGAKMVMFCEFVIPRSFQKFLTGKPYLDSSLYSLHHSILSALLVAAVSLATIYFTTGVARGPRIPRGEAK